MEQRWWPFFSPLKFSSLPRRSSLSSRTRRARRQRSTHRRPSRTRACPCRCSSRPCALPPSLPAPLPSLAPFVSHLAARPPRPAQLPDKLLSDAAERLALPSLLHERCAAVYGRGVELHGLSDMCTRRRHERLRQGDRLHVHKQRPRLRHVARPGLNDVQQRAGDAGALPAARCQGRGLLHPSLRLKRQPVRHDGHARQHRRVSDHLRLLVN